MLQAALPFLLLLLSTQISLIAGQYTPVVADQVVEQNKLTQARATWNSRVPFTSNYQFTMQKECHACCWKNTCGADNYPWEVQVNYDQYIYGNQYTGTKAKDEKAGAVYGAKDMNQIFDEIQAVLNAADQFVEAEYDPYWGNPTRYKIQAGVDPNSDSTTLTEVSVFYVALNSASQLSLFNNGVNLWSRAFPPGALKNYEFDYFDYSPDALRATYPIVVTVTNGAVSSAYDSAGVYMGLNVLDIDGYFAQLDRQINLNSPWIDNVYDPQLGFPSYMYVINGATTGAAFGHVEITYFSFLI